MTVFNPGAQLGLIIFAAFISPSFSQLWEDDDIGRQLREELQEEFHEGMAPVHSPESTLGLHSVPREGGHHHHTEEEGGHAGETAEERWENKEVEKDHEFQFIDLVEALMLLGSICFVMTLFYMVNHPVDDLKFYSWSVISTTISIFVAVFMFSSINIVINEVLLAGRGYHVLTGGALMQMMSYFVLLQVSAAYLTGALHEKPFDRDKTRRHPKLRYMVSVSIKEQKDEAERHVKCWTTLLSHMTGFAAVNFGGVMQQTHFFRKHPPLTFIAGPSMYVLYVLLCWSSRRIRRHFVSSRIEEEVGYDELSGNDEEERGSRHWAMTTWDTEVYEAEVDIAALGVSFLTVQACRFNITGVLPDQLGIEEHHFVHPLDCTWQLLGCSLGFCVGLVVTVVLLVQFPKAVVPGTCVSLLKRMVIVLQNAMAMAFAFSLLYSVKWELARFPELGSPNAMTARLILAILISFVAFALIWILDMFAMSDLGGHATDEAIFNIIGGLGILVGFSWEQSFDGGVEVIAALTPHPLLTELVLALVVTIVVMPAWQRYILKTVIELSEEREEKKELAKEASRDLCGLDTCCGHPQFLRRSENGAEVPYQAEPNPGFVQICFDDPEAAEEEEENANDREEDLVMQEEEQDPQPPARPGVFPTRVLA